MKKEIQYPNKLQSMFIHDELCEKPLGGFCCCYGRKINKTQPIDCEDKNITIAKACGWKDCHKSENWGVTIGTLYKVDGNQYAILPDYLSDLNAMHKAELTLSDSDAITFRCIATQMGVDRNYDPFFSSASQRAEAFLKTLNLWKDKYETV